MAVFGWSGISTSSLLFNLFDISAGSLLVMLVAAINHGASCVVAAMGRAPRVGVSRICGSGQVPSYSYTDIVIPATYHAPSNSK